MLSLLSKAKYIFLTVLAIYLFSYGAGYLAGKMDWVDYWKLKQSPVLKFSSNLEYKVPGYGDLLKSYKNWHNKQRNQYLSSKDKWGFTRLIFINNWIVANFTMIIRSLFFFPITLSIMGKFFQGVIFAQVPGSSRMASVFLLEFGGYFLTICATLSGLFWTIFYKHFKFDTRKQAVISGLKLLGMAFLFSAIGMLIGSIIEADFILSMYNIF